MVSEAQLCLGNQEAERDLSYDSQAPPLEGLTSSRDSTTS